VRASAAIVALVVAIGVAATIDALRDSGDDADSRRPAAPETDAPPPRVAKLRGAGVIGELYFTVKTEAGCRLRALSLPSLQDAASFELSWCRFDLSTEGNVVAGPPCPGRTFEILSVDELSGGFQGCAPAWRPNGGLTFVRDGDVLTPTGDILVRNVARFARNAVGRGRLEVRQLAWLSNTRLAVLIGTLAVDHAVVIVIEDDRAVSEPIFADRQDTLDVLRHSQELFGRRRVRRPSLRPAGQLRICEPLPVRGLGCRR
jgi:hypothetical protein